MLPSNYSKGHSMFEILTRRQAAEAGLKRYYTGKSCSKGHDAQRFVSTGVCVKCAAGYVKEYNGRMRKAVNAKAVGLFIYPAHPDDVAALLAYAQALDLQRGRPPHVPATPTVVRHEPTHEELMAIRERAFGVV